MKTEKNPFLMNYNQLAEEIDTIFQHLLDDHAIYLHPEVYNMFEKLRHIHRLLQLQLNKVDGKAMAAKYIVEEFCVRFEDKKLLNDILDSVDLRMKADIQQSIQEMKNIMEDDKK